MKEIKNKQIIITIIVFSVALILSLYVLFNYVDGGVYAKYYSSDGLKLFYMLSDVGTYILATIILTFLPSNFINLIFYQNKYDKFQNFIVTRVGYKKRIKYEIKNVLITSFIFRLIINIALLLIINLFFNRIVFHEYADISMYPEGVAALFPNSKVSLILFILYSSIGFSIYSLFIYSMIYIIKNKYMYKVSSIMLFVALVMLAAVSGNILYKSFSNIKFANPILQALATTSLICPGLETFTSINSYLEIHLYFFYTCICFLIYSFIFIYIRYRGERKNG